MLASFLVLATTILAETAKPSPPELKLIGITETDGMVAASFKVINPNSRSLPYLGYTPDSFDPKIPNGTIVPLHKIESFQGKEWKEHKLGWCGTGIGPVSIPAKGTVTFAVLVSAGEWEKLRVGLVWFASTDEKDHRTTWSGEINRKDVKKDK